MLGLGRSWGTRCIPAFPEPSDFRGDREAGGQVQLRESGARAEAVCVQRRWPNMALNGTSEESS